MNPNTKPLPAAAFATLDTHTFVASPLTRGPWHPDHQHAGPPIALVCRAIERAAAEHGLGHVSRLTANLLRPVPIGELRIAVEADYVGRNAAHFSARLTAAGKDVARFTALAQREVEVLVPDAGRAARAAADRPAAPAGARVGDATRSEPVPAGPPRPNGPDDSPPATFPFAGRHVGYADLVETRVAHGRFFNGPCAIWFRLRHPLLEGEAPSAYQRVAVAADSGNGISAVLDFAKYTFVNSDLTVNLLRRPVGEWICLDARTHLGHTGSGLAESTLFDTQGIVGRATQSLLVRPRD